LKDLEEMPDMMIGLSLGGEEVLSDPLYEQMGGLHLNDEEYEAKRRR
ncbi:hypothetical protein A2U01_0034660, partial [Trifolium medium]|nr:hypothetical protein [Trifolium medium]